jgi:hypothetical protein
MFAGAGLGVGARGSCVEQLGTKEARRAIQTLEEYEETVRRFLDELPPEQRLAGLSR